jgi:hypothetical protein
MMARGPTFRQQDLTRALKAARAAGVDIARFEIENGKIVVVTGKPERKQATDLDNWMAMHQCALDSRD